MYSICDEQLAEVTEEDCCGNGCSNCILDTKPSSRHRVDKTGKKNIILNYSKYKLLGKSPHTPNLVNVMELHFVSANTSKSADYMLDIPAGHHLMMRAPVANDAEKEETKYLCRPYSPYWVHTMNLEFKILVNLKPNGPMSQYITRLHEGDEVEFRGPIGSIELVMGNDSPQCYFIITQGVAIASTLPVIEQLLADEKSFGRIFYFGCFQDLNHVYFRERLLEYNKYWNFKESIYLSHQKCGSTTCADHGCTNQCENFRKSLRYKEPVYTRRLDIKELEDICRDVGKAEKIFIICGTRQFQDNFAKSIRDMEVQIDIDKIFKL